MMKKFGKLGMALSLAASMALPQLAQAESRWSVGSVPLSAHADLKLKVIVPKIIILKVGDLGGTVNEITWDATPPGTTVTNAVYTGAIPPTTSTTVPFNVSDNETVGNGQGTIAVQVFGNAGDVSLSSTTSTPGFLTDVNTAFTIPLGDITVTPGAATPHPAFDGGASTITATNGIVNPGPDTWVYAYNPATTPAAGTYTTTVRYTAANP